jgi:hypothetical protein
MRKNSLVNLPARGPHERRTTSDELVEEVKNMTKGETKVFYVHSSDSIFKNETAVYSFRAYLKYVIRVPLEIEFIKMSACIRVEVSIYG